MKQIVIGKYVISLLLTIVLVVFAWSVFFIADYLMPSPKMSVEGQTLDVTDGKDSLIIRPGTIYVDAQKPTSIQVTTSLKLNCSIVNLTSGFSKSLNCSRETDEGSSPVLKFWAASKKSEDTKEGEVKIQQVASPPKWPWPWIAAILSLAVAGLSFIQFWSSSNQILVAELPGIQSRIAALTDRMRPAHTLVANRPAIAAPFSITSTLPTQPPLPERIALFLKAAGAWCRAARNSNQELPWPVTNGLEEIREMSSQPVYSEDIQARFRELAIGVVRSALSHSDGMLDPAFKNNVLQSAINQLVEKAGLNLIQPLTGALLNDKFHHMAGQQPARIEGQRGRICNVVRRGLKSNQSTVICRAEVNIYD